MSQHSQSAWYKTLPLFCHIFLLVLLLAACGGETSTSTPAPQPTPTKASLNVYDGDGFTMSYPAGWTAKKGTNRVEFSDSLGVSTLVVQDAPNPGGTTPTSLALSTALRSFESQAKNYQKVETASSTMVGGENWDQAAATGDVTKDGQTANAKFIVIATNHPPKALDTKLFVIYYATAAQLFDLSNSSAFQPMLRSFKFK